MYIWRYFSSLIHLYKAIYLISYIKNNVLPIDSYSLWTQTFILLMNTIVTKALTSLLWSTQNYHIICASSD